MRYLENEKNEKKILLILAILTFLINICRIAESKMIYMSEDEFGPIAIAAYFCGQDWTSVLQNTSYYSYGYSLVLTPLFWIAGSAESFYRMAIAVNAVFTAAIILLSYYTGKRICFYTKKTNLYMSSFAAANFVANVGRSQSAWCETILIFLFWCLIFNFTLLEEKINLKRVLSFSGIAVFTYMVHQRTIGILISAVFCFVILCFVKKYDKKYLIGFCGVTLALLFAHTILKQFVQTNIWLNSPALQGNDYGGRLQQIASRGIIPLLKMAVYTVSGHLYYIAASTFGLGIFALCILIKKIIARERALYFFLGLSATSAFAVSILGVTPAGWEEWGSSSYLVYGRYIEIFLGILIYLSLMFFLENLKDKTAALVTLGGIIFAALITVSGWSHVKELWFNNHCCIGLNAFYKNGDMIFWFPLALIAVCLAVLYYVQNGFEKRIYVGALSAFWIFSGISYLEDPLYVEQTNYQLTKLIEEKERRNKECDFYFYGSDATYNDTFMQFLLKDKQPLIFQSDYSVIPKETFYGVTDDASFFEVNPDLKQIKEVKGVYLFTNE